MSGQKVPEVGVAVLELTQRACLDLSHTLARDPDLRTHLLERGRLAIADPSGVPAGKYGKAALEALGVWPSVADKLAPAENVRATLLLVSRGEAPLGIVYQTDAVADKGVKVLGTFPANTHPPIIYPIAAVTSSSNPGDAGYIAYMKSPAAGAVFAKQGFTVLE